MKKINSLMCIMMTMVLLSGCSLFGGEFDASGYVKASLDAEFRGESEKLAELAASTEEKVQKNYEDKVTGAFNQVTYGLALTDQQSEEFRALIKELLLSVKYEVGEAEKESKSLYTVEVTVKPLVGIDAEGSDYQKYQEDFARRVEDGEFDNMEEAEVYAIAAAELLELYRDYVKNPMYDEERSVTIRVEKEESGNVFHMNESDLEALGEALF